MLAGNKDGATKGVEVDGLNLAAGLVTGRGAGDGIPHDGFGVKEKNAGVQKTKNDRKDSSLIALRDRRLTTAAGAKGHAASALGDAVGHEDALLADVKGIVRRATAGNGTPGFAAKAGEAAEADADPRFTPAGKSKKTVGAGAAGDAIPLLAMVTQAHSADNGANALTGCGKAGDAGEGQSIEASAPAKSARKDKKSIIGVRDERTDAASGVADTAARNVTLKEGEANTAEMSISFRPAGERSSFSDSAGLKSSQGTDGNRSFSSMLSQELQASAGEFVRAGQIVLRDNDAGVIKLTLHPESLGNVKISLELSGDKKISGKIVVASQEAYDAFNESLGSLQDAFAQSGFDATGFDLSFAGQGSGDGARGEGGRTDATPFYAQSIPDVMPAAFAADSDRGAGRYAGMSAINVFA